MHRQSLFCHVGIAESFFQLYTSKDCLWHLANPSSCVQPGRYVPNFLSIKNAQGLFGCGGSQRVLKAGMCGHRYAAIEAFLGRVSKGKMSRALGEAVTEGTEQGKHKGASELSLQRCELLCGVEGIGG